MSDDPLIKAQEKLLAQFRPPTYAQATTQNSRAPDWAGAIARQFRPQTESAPRTFGLGFPLSAGLYGAGMLSRGIHDIITASNQEKEAARRSQIRQLLTGRPLVEEQQVATPRGIQVVRRRNADSEQALQRILQD